MPTDAVGATAQVDFVGDTATGSVRLLWHCGNCRVAHLLFYGSPSKHSQRTFNLLLPEIVVAKAGSSWRPSQLLFRPIASAG